jgi:probable HAF family extracellular repeat protein
MHAFRYDSNTAKAVDLGVLPGVDESRAKAINNKGQITGESFFADPHAFLWDGKLIDLGLVFSSNDINDSGVIVGSRFFPGASERTAFRYPSANNNPQFEDLGPLPLRGGFVGSHASAINNNGDIVGYSWTKDGLTRAFVRKAVGLMQDLTSLIPHISGWLLTQATDINDKGEIIGNGVLNGNHRGFLLTPLSLSVGIDRYYQAIDPMALILSSRIYQIWVQIHHPHEIKVSEIKEVLQSMAPAERTAVLNRARRFADLGKAVEEAFEELKE